MTSEEWYNSKRFKHLRAIHNTAHDVVQTLQKLRDLLDMLLEEEPTLPAFDKCTIALQQLKITQLEANNLTSAITDLRSISKLSPKLESNNEGIAYCNPNDEGQKLPNM